jgi:predicted restriction endonuclease
LQLVTYRKGQSKFRKLLLEEFDGKCAISGSRVEEILEAAHIRPYDGPHTNIAANGILLRADLHTLFDLNLIKINPKTSSVVIDKTLAKTEYKQYQGIKPICKVTFEKKQSAFKWRFDNY